MAWLGNIASHVLWNIMNSDVQPNLVQEVKSQQYNNRHILCREDAIVLYSPSTPSDKYEIVIHKPCMETLHQAYNLYRTQNKEEAERYFIMYKNKVPILTQIC